MDFVKVLKSATKLKNVQTVNSIFKLHYKFTSSVLLALSLVLTSKQYFGNAITCQCNNDKEKNYAEAFCYISGTFVIKSTLTDGFMHSGLGNEVGREILWENYYQWVSIVLCVQAAMFYLPYFLWKHWEGGKLALLVKDLGGPVISPTWTSAVKSNLVEYLGAGHYSHSVYAARYFLCETLNLLNIMSQIFFTNWLLNKQFMYYGLSYASNDEMNPLNLVFPKVTKCNYEIYGPSGSLQKRDAVCVLSLNFLNEKLFLVIWFWFMFLAVMSLLAFAYRIFIVLSTKMRAYLLISQTRCLDTGKFVSLAKQLSYGEFFVLYHIGNNVNPMIYRDLIFAIHDSTLNKGKEKTAAEV